jgi:hypothetical protein
MNKKEQPVLQELVLKHYSDPSATKAYCEWPFVYLIGLAQHHNREIAENNGWEWREPDMFVVDMPMPAKAGNWAARLYGMKISIFLRENNGRIEGRAAAPSDSNAFESGQEVEKWKEVR